MKILVPLLTNKSREQLAYELDNDFLLIQSRETMIDQARLEKQMDGW